MLNIYKMLYWIFEEIEIKCTKNGNFYHIQFFQNVAAIENICGQIWIRFFKICMK